MVDRTPVAPDFALSDQAGETVSLRQYRGHPVVVYFYPKDDTEGCTVEAKDFSCLADQFLEIGTPVIGISPDSPRRHKNFKVKYDLKVRLLSDAEKTTALAYGVWVEKMMFGRRYMGVERATFLIDGSGRIVKSWRKVNVRGHAEEVLAAAKALAARTEKSRRRHERG